MMIIIIIIITTIIIITIIIIIIVIIVVIIIIIITIIVITNTIIINIIIVMTLEKTRCLGKETSEEAKKRRLWKNASWETWQKKAMIFSLPERLMIAAWRS